MGTLISQYLRWERADRSEPVDFYAPGARDWNDPWLRKYMAERVDGPAEEPVLTDDEVRELLN